MIKGAVFDMDGLMFDTEKLHFDSYGIAAKEFGYTMTKEIFCRLLGGSYERNMAILREEMGPDYPLEEVEKRTGAKTRIINYVGPVIGAHTGAGVIALCFVAKER